MKPQQYHGGKLVGNNVHCSMQRTAIIKKQVGQVLKNVPAEQRGKHKGKEEVMTDYDIDILMSTLEDC